MQAWQCADATMAEKEVNKCNTIWPERKNGGERARERERV